MSIPMPLGVAKPTKDAQIRALLKEEKRILHALGIEYEFDVRSAAELERQVVRHATEVCTPELAEAVQSFEAGCREVGLDPGQVVRTFDLLRSFHIANLQ